MAKFRATSDDLNDLIRREKSTVLKRQAAYPLSALAAGCILLAIFPPAGFLALGMSLAWTLSTVWEINAVARLIAWRYAWMLQDNVEIEVRDEGVHVSTERGNMLYSWGRDMVVRSLGKCFVVEDMGEDLVVLPKRHLDSQELVAIERHVQS